MRWEKKTFKFGAIHDPIHISERLRAVILQYNKLFTTEYPGCPRTDAIPTFGNLPSMIAITN